MIGVRRIHGPGGRGVPRLSTIDDGGVMADYRRERDFDTHPDRLYNYLADVANLPSYFTQMTSAHKVGPREVHTTAEVEMPGQGRRRVEGEVWFRTDKQARQIEWGSEGANNYRGRVLVSERDDQGCSVLLKISTEAEHPGVEEGIDKTLDNIARATDRAA